MTSRFKPLQNGAVLCCGANMLVPYRSLVFQTPSKRGGIVLEKR